MGQKVNPISMRVQATRNWRSKWFASSKKEYAKWLATDIKLRRQEPLLTASTSSVQPTKRPLMFGPRRLV